MTLSLSQADVTALLADPCGDTRSATAERLASQFDQGRLTEAERRIAEDIFRLMVRDTELRVREALSRHLRASPALPHDVALALANDVDSVALPVLLWSEVLTEADLVAIVRSQGTAKQMAVARRSSVSAPVSAALVDTGKEEVIVSLLDNPGADIAEPALARVATDGGPAAQARLAVRPALPLAVAERLVARVSDDLRRHLMGRSDISEGIATSVTMLARERVVLGLTEGAEADVEALVRQLVENDRLTPSIILRALCMGDIAFFEAALAARAAIPLINARVLIHDAGPLGLHAIFDKAALPASFYPAGRAALDVMRELQLDGEPHDRERHARQVMERVLTQYGELGVDFAAGDLDYLLARLEPLRA